MSSPRCIVTVHAHPDDESSKGPGTIAAYRARGIRSVLVCCSDGAEGDVLNPALDAEAVKREAMQCAEERKIRFRIQLWEFGDCTIPGLGCRFSGKGKVAHTAGACAVGQFLIHDVQQVGGFPCAGATEYLMHFLRDLNRHGGG